MPDILSPQQTADELLKELNLENLKGKQRQKVLAKLEEHFGSVILSTVVKHLSDEQFERFKNAVESEDIEEEVAKITAEVPGLAEIIQKRLDEEMELMKGVMSA